MAKATLACAGLSPVASAFAAGAFITAQRLLRQLFLEALALRSRPSVSSPPDGFMTLAARVRRQYEMEGLGITRGE